jgi:hypothetical protein
MYFADLLTFWREEKSRKTRISTTTTQPFNSINAEIDHRDNGSVLIAQRISNI